MGSPAARIGDPTVHGGTIIVGLPTVLIGGPPASRIGDMHVCPQVTGIVPHVGGPLILGSFTVLTGGVPQSRVGDALVCVGPPDAVAMGCPTVLVGMAGGGLGFGAMLAGLTTALGPSLKPTAAGDEGGAKGSGGAGGGSGAVRPGLPTSIPKSCKDAPKTIVIPKNINEAFQKLWGGSFPGGKSQEQGGTLVKDDKGGVSVVNQSSGNSGSFSPNRVVPAGQTVIGIFHTHPYDASEGGSTGVSFSGADISIAANNREPSYVQSGDQQFMIMPTDETPKDLDYEKVNDEQNERIEELTKAGTDFSEASRIAAKETAVKNKMAYYEGKDGVLQRVSC